MGLDVGWHLRFARAQSLEAVFDPGVLPQVEDHLYIVGGWDMTVEERDGALLARFTRRRSAGPDPARE